MKGSKRENDYTQFFEMHFGPLVILILWLFTSSLELATFYAPNPEECAELAPHASRLAVRIEDLFKLPKWVHEAVTSSEDVISLGLIVVGYLDRIGALEKIRPYFEVPNGKQSPRSDAPVQPSTQNGSRGDIDVTKIPGLGAQYYEPI